MEDNLKEVFVVSTNIISSLGFTSEENIQSIIDLKTGIAESVNPEIYPEPFQAAVFDREKLNRLIAENGLSEYSPAVASGILSILLCCRKTACKPVFDEKTRLILSTTKGNIAALSGKIPPENEVFLDKTAKEISLFFNMGNEPIVISNACVSGVSAITAASRLLETGRADNVFVLGLDFVTAFTVSGFQSFKSISPQPCRPYDARRDGLSIGEAVGCIWLTNNEKQACGERKIRILSGATSNDANHISGPSRTGDGLSLAMENALKYSGIRHEDVDFVNLHGTATVYNDEMESKAMRLSNLSKTPSGSLKGYFGHTLGASGVIETAVCIESLKCQTLFATLGYEIPGTSEPLNLASTHKKADIHTFLKTASGFGGFNSAIAFSDRILPKKKPNKAKPVFTELLYTVKDNKIARNGETVFSSAPALPFHDFIKAAYRHLEIDYPKFHKMDELCKLAFACFEYMTREIPDFEHINRQKTALVFSTVTSSLDTDIKHRQTISDRENYFPSPAVFVYTLPNIMLGEIAIRHRIQGETTCFVGKINENDLQEYIRLLAETTDTEFVVYGNVDFLSGKYSARLKYAFIC